MDNQVISEHRRLEDLFEALERAFADAQPVDSLWQAFEQLSEELQTHFEQEEHLYFPSIWALCPELKQPLGEAGDRHAWFRDQLRLLGDHLGHDDKEGAARVFRGLDESFRLHEQFEEQLLTRLDAALED